MQSSWKMEEGFPSQGLLASGRKQNRQTRVTLGHPGGTVRLAVKLLNPLNCDNKHLCHRKLPRVEGSVGKRRKARARGTKWVRPWGNPDCLLLGNSLQIPQPGTLKSPGPDTLFPTPPPHPCPRPTLPVPWRHPASAPVCPLSACITWESAGLISCKAKRT